MLFNELLTINVNRAALLGNPETSDRGFSMSRLNQRAFDILQAEVKRQTGEDLAGKTQREILLKRLEKLRVQPGAPLTEAELRQAVLDMLPNFSPKDLKKAVQVNRPPGPWQKIKIVSAGLIAIAGSLYVLNLPYPMIRWPVARLAPALLLPSFISMDYHYRQAVSLAEQADQLVNQPTSAQDLRLGATKVNAAQRHLDALPVWFLGYAPQYSGFWHGWRFTFDEFRAARTNIGRLEAKLFQEKQAQTLLNQADQALQAAQQQYQQSQTVQERSTAIAAWQAALDLLAQIPSETLAGRMAQTKLLAHNRDFQQVAGWAAGSQRSGTLMEAAQAFAQAAAKASANPPYTATEWTEIEQLWQTGMERLQLIPVEDPGYGDAQKLLAAYQTQLGEVRVKRETELNAVETLQQSQDLIQSLVMAAPTRLDHNQLRGQLQEIMTQLESVPTQTTAYPEAQRLFQLAEQKLAQL